MSVISILLLSVFGLIFVMILMYLGVKSLMNHIHPKKEKKSPRYNNGFNLKDMADFDGDND